MRNKANAQAVEAVSKLVEDIDYRLTPDDFVFYELGRLIEEDRASFDDADFRRLIDEGIQQHVEENLELRAEMASRLRRAYGSLGADTGTVAVRVVAALEDVTSDLRNVAVVVRTYTAYLFRGLEVMEERLAGNNDYPQAVDAADLLFEDPEDRVSAETAIDVLGRLRTAISARVLAHAVSEPMLDEGLEEKAYDRLKHLWPLPRFYVLYSLRSHTHEDLPFRWFQLLSEVNEILAVDQILEEFRLHGDSPAFREDLVALLEPLKLARDPETEEKILEALNDSDISREAAQMLESFLKSYERPEPLAPENNPWLAHSKRLDVNRRYLAAAKAADSGKVAEAKRMLDDILTVEPNYPFAASLQKIIGVSGSPV